MTKNLLTGELTRLVVPEPEQVGEAYARWSRDSEFLQLSDNHIALPTNAKQIQEMNRAQAEHERPQHFPFLIQRLEDERLIGEAGLWNALNAHGNAWLGIGIGERELWGKGYGSDAMKILLRYAFQELNLHRVSLGTFEYNPRAIRTYEKLGFVHEGRMRHNLKRNGKYWDGLVMGILQTEWRVRQNES